MLHNIILGDKQMTNKATNKTNLITSPVGNIKFSALRSARKEQDKADGTPGRLLYSMRLEIEPTSAGADAFKTTLSDINDNLVVTRTKAGKLAPGHYLFNTKSINKPKVYDKDMNQIDADLIPMIESGTARVIFSSFEGKGGLGGGLNLVGVQLLDVVEFVGSEAVDESDIVAQLKANQA